MRSLVALTVLVLTALSLAWTTIKARKILSQALGRKLRKGEETSLRSWMEAPDSSLNTAIEELDRNPFERMLRFLNSFNIWKDDRALRPASRARLTSAER